MNWLHYVHSTRRFSSTSVRLLKQKQKVDNGIYQIRLKINQLQNENALIVEKQKASAEYQAVQNIIDQTNKQLDDIREQVNNKTRKLGQLQQLQKIYSLDGVLKLIIEQWIPVLNDEIAENLLLLNFPYTLKFDNNSMLRSATLVLMYQSRHCLKEKRPD